MNKNEKQKKYPTLSRLTALWCDRNRARSLKAKNLVQLVVQDLELTVESLSASEARANLFSLVEQVNQDHSPRVITSRKGDAVLLSKGDWESIQETLYLQSIPGFVDSIRAAEQANDWRSESEFLQALDDLDH